MPPKLKITKDMIINAGFCLIRDEGIAALNVRSLSARLNCSTQPVMHHFATVEMLIQAIYRYADAFHSEYLLSCDVETDNPMLAIGLRYIRFAMEEKHLFRFLFQSDQFTNNSISDLLNGDDLLPFIQILREETGLTLAQSREVFASLFIAAHGFASLHANNAMHGSESDCAKILEMIFMGLIGTMKGECI